MATGNHGLIPVRSMESRKPETITSPSCSHWLERKLVIRVWSWSYRWKDDRPSSFDPDPFGGKQLGPPSTRNRSLQVCGQFQDGTAIRHPSIAALRSVQPSRKCQMPGCLATYSTDTDRPTNPTTTTTYPSNRTLPPHQHHASQQN